MNDKKIYDTVSGIDEELLDRSLARKTHGSPKKGFRWGVLAACLAVIVVLSSTAVTLLAAEAKEYNAALDFFAENGLPAEGLSRSDVKAVYRDITQKKFTCEKTEDVIRKAVPGLVIEYRLTPKELADLWSKITSLKYPDLNKERIFFDYHSVYDADGVYQKSILRCRRFDELLWSAEFPGLYIGGYLYTGDGTVVWGHPHEDYTHSWIALVNNDGKTEWQNQPDHGFGLEIISSVLPNEDGIIEVFGYTRGTDIADTDYLCLSRYDRSGKELYFRNTETVSSRGVKKAAHLGDGYIVQNWDNDLLKLDKDGKLIDTVTFEADDCTYRITDMIEFSGRVYVSAYSTPKQDYELGDVIEYLRLKYYSKGIYDDDVPSEEVTRLIQDNYTAVLLVCDPESITPQAFYSVKESLGGTLSVNGSNELEWEVENIVYAEDSPYVGNFKFLGISEIYVCTFDSDGTLVSETDSGRTALFLR